MKNIPYKFELIIITLITILFIFLQPKLSVVLFPQKRQVILNNFLENTQSNKKIDARIFWQFREFYYPGYFTFERLGIKKSMYSITEKKLRIKLSENSLPYVFLIYTSNKFNSLEALVTKDILSDVVVDLSTGKKNIIFQNNSELVYKTGGRMRIIFVKPQNEMVKSNGYFDYKNPRDMAILQTKYWLSVSEILLK